MATQPRWAKAGFLVRRKRAPQAKLPPSERSEGQQVAARERRTRKARRGPGPSAAMAIRGRTAGPRMGPRQRAGPGPREGRPLRAVPDYGQPQPRGESVSGAKTHRLSREALNRRPRCGPSGPHERWSYRRRLASTCAEVASTEPRLGGQQAAARPRPREHAYGRAAAAGVAAGTGVQAAAGGCEHLRLNRGPAEPYCGRVPAK